MRYDFAKLSGVDFEELIHDLLSTCWGLSLEIFKTGKDGGVDLRGFSDGEQLIVQCKNYAGTAYSVLKGRMKDEELPKVRRLNPGRYILATSLPLSVAQKDDLAALLCPYVQSSSDIIGGNEIERMLEAEPAIVKRHHKLWLTSVPVLERILHAAEHEQTKAHVERVARKLPLFVQTKAYGRALDVLQDKRVVIVSGEPGIGKTTLADMLLYAHVSEGFTPAVIHSGLAEGRRLASGGAPVIFHFDDFLGQTFLGDRPDFLGRKEDADLVDFVDWVMAHDQHRFVLTTREHVLADALQRSEKLRHHGLADERCVITVGDFSREQRARILYNHLYFSDLPLPYRTEMLRDDFFLEIVDSRNFNPRIVEWLASERRLRSISPERYQEHVRALIKNPHEIWRHAFQHELSQAARDVLIARHSLSYSVFADDLERAFESLHTTSTNRTNQRRTLGAWRSAMRELEGSFLEVRKGEVDFINPSVRDFLAGVIQDDPAVALDLIVAAVRFNQLTDLWEGARTGGPFQAVHPRLVQQQAKFAEALEKLIDAPHLRWFKEPEGTFGRYVDSNMPSRARSLFEIQCELPAVRSIALQAITRVSDEIRSGALNINDVTGMMEWFWKRNDTDASDVIIPVVLAVKERLRDALAEDWLALLRLRDKFDCEIETHIPDMEDEFAVYASDGVDNDIWNCSSRDDYENLQYFLEEIQEKFHYNFSSAIDNITEKLDGYEDPEPEKTPGAFERDYSMVEEESETDDDSLRAMFGSLIAPR